MTPEELMALIAVAGLALIILLVVAVFIFVFSWRVGINAVKGQNTETGAILVTALINFVISIICSFIPYGWLGWLVNLIISLLVIKKRHDTSFLGALGAWIISWIIALILIIIAAIVIFMIFAPGLVAFDVILGFFGL